MHRCSNRAMFRIILLAPVILLLAAFIPAPVDSQSSSITIDLRLPAYEIAPDAAGFDVITAEGFTQTGHPGAPLLPHRVVNVGLPPDADLETLQIEVLDQQTEVLPGTYRIRTAVPDQTTTGATAAGISATPPARDASIALLPHGQMRRYRFARVSFAPFTYEPASGTLSVIRRATVRITYDTTNGAAMTAAQLADSTMDDVVRELLLNFDQVRRWYPVDNANAPDVTYDYVIITTNAIVSGSSQLANFVAHKQSKGLGVLVVTETDYGGLSGQAPNGRAEKIRKWLQDHYASYAIRYVLLIGNPDPDDPTTGSDSVGDVPMKMCYPRLGAGDGFEESPTDYFYADLTGNWNLDGDPYFGEWTGDMGSGGVDLAHEVSVGRIPVYGGNTAMLDAILLKTMAYENDANFWPWRWSALLPMSFSTGTYDGAPLAEQMTDDYLDAANFSSWTMYQQGSGACGLNSTYASNQELRGGTGVRDRWAANDYGLVLWWGHGSETSAVVGYSPCWDGTLLNSSYTSSLDDGHPAFVFQNSCLNGYPEASDNLQYSLLKNGAVTTVGATRVSWFNQDVHDFDGSTTNSGIGYEYAKRIVAYQQSAGNALYNTKSSILPEYDTRLMNMYDFNLYGDPSLVMLRVPPTFDQRVYLPLVLR